MLNRLAVSNLAIVERAEAEFAPALNVITGETGAGKSVLMGALELALGSRADASAVREGAKEASVEAEFTVPAAVARDVASLLDEVGIPFEDSTLVVRRSISSAGTGRVRINDVSSTVATLRRLGSILVDIHGPRANQNILTEDFQRAALDSCGNVDCAAYVAAWDALSSLRRRKTRLDDEGGRDEELDLLRYQVSEIDEVGVTEADDDIAERHAAAAHASEIVSSANDITELLTGDDSAVEKLVAMRPLLASISRHFPSAAEWMRETEDVTVRLQELSRSVAETASKMDAGTEDFEELDGRFSAIQRLKRKYGEDLVGIVARKRDRLAELERRGAELEELAEKISAAERNVAKAGKALSSARAAAGETIAKAVSSELRDLGFLQAKFFVKIEPCEPHANGCDRVTYMFEPNPGEPARPLAETASSGETARVMLALKSVLSAHDRTDVLVFDEIDANIGGEVGRIVGEKMAKVAKHHQVIAITHLPQCAACGARHLVVSKSVADGRTRTKVEPVGGEARVREIARMLGGAEGDAVVARHAEELLGRVARKG